MYFYLNINKKLPLIIPYIDLNPMVMWCREPAADSGAMKDKF